VRLSSNCESKLLFAGIFYDKNIFGFGLKECLILYLTIHDGGDTCDNRDIFLGLLIIHNKCHMPMFKAF
jgi:hypothetical protein